jgi:hypothetical protein
VFSARDLQRDARGQAICVERAGGFFIVSRHCVDDVRSKPRSVAEWRSDGTPLRFVPDYEPSTRCRETTGFGGVAKGGEIWYTVGKQPIGWRSELLTSDEAKQWGFLGGHLDVRADIERLGEAIPN